MLNFAKGASRMVLLLSAGLLFAETNYQLVRIGSVKIGDYNPDGGVAEITAYDPGSKRAFSVWGAADKIAIVDLANPAAPVKVSDFAYGSYSANSVAAKNGVFAVAFQAPDKVSFGRVVFYTPTGTVLKEVAVGSQPDMITFTPDGKYALTANEGEPNSYGQSDSIDPEGSVSIIDLRNGIANATVNTATFTSFNPQVAALKAAGVRIYGPGATVAQDLEPEFIAVSPDSTTAYVTLQENNAIAIVNIASANVTGIYPLGYKNHNLASNGYGVRNGDGQGHTIGASNALDASDQNGGVIDIANWPVFGMYEPDGIAAFQWGGNMFLITANEGDAREYTGFPSGSELRRLSSGSVVLDATAYPNGGDLKTNNSLNRLNISDEPGTNPSSGDLDGNGTTDRIQALGARSFSIWNTNITQVFDSGDQMEKFIQLDHPDYFNVSHTNNTKKNRSDDKGPEPESVVTYEVGGRQFATIGLERDSGLMSYDLVSPSAPAFVGYATGRKFSETPGNNSGGDLGPEGLLFIPASESPNTKPLLLVSNEVSGNVAVWQVRAIREVTENLQVTVTGMTQNNKSTFTGKLKIWNRTAQTIDGPLYFIPRNVEGGATLTNPTGTFQGERYIEIPAVSLLANQQAEIEIEFTPGPGAVNPGRVSFDTHIYVGSL